MGNESDLFELYLEAYATARCGGDASKQFAVFGYRALPFSAVIAVATHDGASGVPPRAWPAVRTAVEAVSAGAPVAAPPAAG